MQTAAPPGGVDPSVLHAFADLAGVDSAREVVDVYLVSAAARLAAIRAGIAADSPVAVRHAAHALASAAGAVGAARVAEIARALEGASAGGWAAPPHATAVALDEAAAESRGRLAAVLADLATLFAGADLGVAPEAADDGGPDDRDFDGAVEGGALWGWKL